MRKRQPGAPGQLLYAVLTVGILVVIGFSAVAIWQWRSRPLPVAPSPIAFYPTRVPPPTYVAWPTPYPTPLPPTPFPTTSQIAGTLLFTGSNASVGTMDDGKETLLVPPIVAGPIASSPDRRTLAYIRNIHLHIVLADGTDEMVAADGSVQFVCWSPDGKALTFITASAGVETLYRLAFPSMVQTRMLVAPQFAAPALWHPSMQRLLIAEPIRQGGMIAKTVVYTIDSACGNIEACQSSRQDFITLPFATDWLDIHPSGLYVVTPDLGDGNLYLISTAKKDITILFNDGFRKFHPIFSPDGSQIVYMDNSHAVYVGQLADLSVARVQPVNDTYFAPGYIAWRY